MTRRPRRSPFFPYTPLSRSRRPGFFPQARPAELVDDGPAGREPVSLFGGRHRREHLASHLGDQRPEGLLHVLRLLVFVVRPLPVEPQHGRSEEHTSELQSRLHLVCRLLLEKKKKKTKN